MAPWGSVGYCTVLHGEEFRGMVWMREVLLRVVKFSPVKHCVVRLGKVLRGIARCRTVDPGFARLRAAGQALVRRHLGLVWPGEVG